MERVWGNETKYERSLTMPMFDVFAETKGTDLGEFMEFLFVTGELDSDED